MAIVVETFIICDGGCGENFGVDNRHLSKREQLASARANAWVRIKGKDYCPNCKPMITMSPREKAGMFGRIN